jgi:IclR family transcriptional regulator, pca regulon regulatory protein
MCFTPDKPMLGIAEMADMLGMSRSTTHRYVITLVQLGYLEQPSSGRKYRLSLRVADLGMAGLNTLTFRIQSRPYLEKLRERTAYTVNMGVISDDAVLIADRLRGFQGHAKLLLQRIGLGSRLPLYGTSLGKVLLAYLPKEEYEKVRQRLVLTMLGPTTITTKVQLTSELEQVRQLGYAVNDGEPAGVRSIAMPIRSDGSVVAAVDVVAPTSMVNRRELVDNLGSHLREVTEEISTLLTGACGKAGTADAAPAVGFR